MQLLVRRDVGERNAPHRRAGARGDLRARRRNGRAVRVAHVDGTRYITEPTGGCATDDDCRSKGTYTLAGGNITLEDDLGGVTQTIALAVLDSGPVYDDGTGR